MLGKRPGNHEGSLLKRADGRWMASVGVGRDQTTGKLKWAYYYGKTRAEVASQLAHAMSDLHRGAFVAPQKLTVVEWLSRWLQGYAQPKVRPATFSNYEMFIRHHLVPALGHLPLQDLRPDHVQRLYNQAIDKGLSPGTVHGLHVVLRAALKQAVRVGVIIRNVTDVVTLPRKKPRKITPMTLEQVRHFLSVPKQDRMFPTVFLALGTGMRRGELLALRWQDVNLDTGVLHVHQALAIVWTHTFDANRKTRLLLQEPKTEHSRRAIPIPESIVDELRHHKARQAQEKLLMGQAYQDNGLVFAEPDGRPIFPSTLARRFKRLLKQADLPCMRLHDVRHTFASLLLEQGEHPKTVQVILGHSKIATTLDTYSHVSLDLEKRAAARLNAALQGPL